MYLKNVAIKLHYVQGDHKQGFQMGITLKHCISDLMLPKPKCVYEVVHVNILACNFDYVCIPNDVRNAHFLAIVIQNSYLGQPLDIGLRCFVFSSILGIRISDKGLAPPQNINF